VNRRADGTAFCNRCRKPTAYHLATVRLYGVEMMPDRICNECDYAIQADRDQDFCPGCGHTEERCTCDEVME